MRKLIIIISLLLISGCFDMSFLFRQQAIQTKPKPQPSEKQLKQRWMALAPHIKEHFDTGDKTTKEIAADLALAHYNESLKKDKK